MKMASYKANGTEETNGVGLTLGLASERDLTSSSVRIVTVSFDNVLQFKQWQKNDDSRINANLISVSIYSFHQKTKAPIMAVPQNAACV